VVNGSSLRLTIVPALQYAAEQACRNQVKVTKASNCTVVIIQPRTGEVLAMAQWPMFNPATITDAAQATDIPVQNVFQPGSTAKVITASAAFERGGQTPMSAYNIPYQITEGSQVIHDAEWASGLGVPSGLGLPGESQGLLPPVSQWAADTRYTLSFGQGVAVTALQMAEVYATIANGGV